MATGDSAVTKNESSVIHDESSEHYISSYKLDQTSQIAGFRWEQPKYGRFDIRLVIPLGVGGDRSCLGLQSGTGTETGS